MAELKDSVKHYKNILTQMKHEWKDIPDHVWEEFDNSIHFLSYLCSDFEDDKAKLKRAFEKFLEVRQMQEKKGRVLHVLDLFDKIKEVVPERDNKFIAATFNLKREVIHIHKMTKIDQAIEAQHRMDAPIGMVVQFPEMSLMFLKYNDAKINFDY